MDKSKDEKTFICSFCKWRDKENAQCFDGHLQYDSKIKCDGFVCKCKGSIKHT